MAIAGDVMALVDDQHFMPRIRQSATDDRSAEAGSDNTISHGAFLANPDMGMITP